MTSILLQKEKAKKKQDMEKEKEKRLQASQKQSDGADDVIPMDATDEKGPSEMGKTSVDYQSRNEQERQRFVHLVSG